MRIFENGVLRKILEHIYIYEGESNRRMGKPSHNARLNDFHYSGNTK